MGSEVPVTSEGSLRFLTIYASGSSPSMRFKKFCSASVVLLIDPSTKFLVFGGGQRIRNVHLLNLI